jgi:hypothetical protein
MPYQLQFVAQAVPASDADVSPFLARLSAASAGHPPAPLMQRFCEMVQALFPCLSQLAPDDRAIDDCPWSDGPLLDHFAGNQGSLAVARRQDEVLPHLLHIANHLGLTVLDRQLGSVHRPQTFQVVLEGPVAGAELAVAAQKLANLMQQPVEQMAALLHARRRTVVKKGVARAQAEKYVSSLRKHADCEASLAREPGSFPPPPAPLVAPLSPEAVVRAADVKPSPAPVAAPAAVPAAVVAIAAEVPAARAVPASPNAASQPANTQNPYAQPQSNVQAEAPGAIDDAQAYRLYSGAEGLRMTCVAIALGIVAASTAQNLMPVAVACVEVALAVMMLVGVVRLAKGAGMGLGGIIGMVLLQFLPLVNLVTLGFLANRNIKALKAAGCHLGLLGASKDDIRELGGLDASEMLTSTKFGWGVAGVYVLALLVR